MREEDFLARSDHDEGRGLRAHLFKGLSIHG